MDAMMNAAARCYLDSPEVTAMTNYPAHTHKQRAEGEAEAEPCSPVTPASPRLQPRHGGKQTQALSDINGETTTRLV